MGKFYFKYSAYFEENYETPMYLGQCDQFISSFWLQRRWILDIEFEFEDIIYSIHPHYMENADELYMLLLICSRINHLQIECMNYMYADLLTEIKGVSNSLLRLLCLAISEAHDEMIETLEEMIDRKN
ncbi:unnamed protein product [Rotaria sp. Silwood1]|nr:unnamed protein product [Rotaria sp. Silwood1]CAF3590225.1 unnamed protein product [Rotaria sp. Silwood1]CAF3868854.1 unnamed protein product [Rotaria sp. Silwood1]CAF4804162.1 unnamed protein product [Rotaria sp. Silwood1]